MTDGGEQGLPDNTIKKHEASPWTVAFVVSIVTLFSFYLLGPFIGMAVAYPFYDGKPMDFLQDLATPIGNESMKMIYLIVQGCATLFGLAIIPTLFWKTMTRRPMLSLFDGIRLKPIHFLMTAGIVFFYLGFNSVVMEWNANIDLPDGSFETWRSRWKSNLPRSPNTLRRSQTLVNISSES
ncbi:MAG: hypothetical protein WDO15_02625 [Bacteroidota bacterium]